MEYPDDNNHGNTEVPEVPTDTGDEDLVPNTQTLNLENAINIAFSGSKVAIENATGIY